MQGHMTASDTNSEAIAMGPKGSSNQPKEQRLCMFLLNESYCGSCDPVDIGF